MSEAERRRSQIFAMCLGVGAVDARIMSPPHLWVTVSPQNLVYSREQDGHHDRDASLDIHRRRSSMFLSFIVCDGTSGRVNIDTTRFKQMKLI